MNTNDAKQIAQQAAAQDSANAAISGAAKSSGKVARAGTPVHGEFLTFRLGQEEYGIDILKVQEIRSYEQPTRIANSPAFIKGVVNLRGVIVPIVDLRIKLNCTSVEYTDLTVVIVLNVKGRVVGTVVDSVSDVLQLTQDAIKPAPDLSSSVDSSFITGIGCVKGGKEQGGNEQSGDEQRMLILMDIEALMSSEEMGLINSIE
jgi:purine-binding chemotaxis protein CheW